MPDIRGQGLPFIKTQPWKRPRLPQLQDGPIGVTNFPTGGIIQLTRRSPRAFVARSYRQPVVLTGTPFVPSRSRVALARTPAQASRPIQRNQKPLLFYTPPRYRTTMVAAPRRVAHSITTRPVTFPVASYDPTPSITLARWRQLPLLRTTFRPPTVTIPAPVARPLRFKLVKWDTNRPFNGFAVFRGPAIIDPATAGELILPIPLRKALARPPAALIRRSIHTLRPPAVLAAAVFSAYPVLRKRLVQLPIGVRRARSAFRPPTVVNAPAAAFTPFPLLRKQLVTLPQGVRRARSNFEPPTIIGAAPTPSFPAAGMAINLVRRPAFPRQVENAVRPPAVVATGVVFTPYPVLRKTLVQLPPGTRRTRSTLRPPTVIAPAAFVPERSRVRLTLTPAIARRSIRVLRPPAIIAAPARTFEPVRVTRAASIPVALRRARPTFRPPVVITAAGTTFAPIRVDLAPSLAIQFRRARPQYRAPIVVGPFAGTTLQQRTLRVTLGRRVRGIQPTRTRFSPPVVVTPFVPPVVTVNAGTDWAAEMSTW